MKIYVLPLPQSVYNPAEVLGINGIFLCEATQRWVVPKSQIVHIRAEARRGAIYFVSQVELGCDIKIFYKVVTPIAIHTLQAGTAKQPSIHHGHTILCGPAAKVANIAAVAHVYHPHLPNGAKYAADQFAEPAAHCLCFHLVVINAVGQKVANDERSVGRRVGAKRIGIAIVAVFACCNQNLLKAVGWYLHLPGH